MANEIGNLYEELEEELNVTQTDVDSVLKAIDEKIKWYGKKINNPKYKAIVPIKTKALKNLKTQILLNNYYLLIMISSTFSSVENIS